MILNLHTNDGQIEGKCSSFYIMHQKQVKQRERLSSIDSISKVTAKKKAKKSEKNFNRK